MSRYKIVLVVKNLPSNAGDVRDLGLIPGSGKSPGEGHSNPLQYSCLENPMDRGAWRVMVHRVTKSRTRLKRVSTDEQYSIVRIYHILFIHLSVDGHLSCFYSTSAVASSTITKHAAMNVCIQLFIWTYIDIISLDQTCKSASLMGQMVKNPPARRDILVVSPVAQMVKILLQ